MNNVQILDYPQCKICISPDYNFFFSKKNGFFARWGETKEDDPQYAPSVELLDIEISEGYCSGNCRWCYKSNGSNELRRYMSLKTFRKLWSKIPNTVCQVALGICDIDSHPKLWQICQFLREEKGVIPNLTCNGLGVTDEVAQKASQLLGAVAVSIVNKESSYNAIQKFTDVGMKQVNIHFVLAEETFEKAKQVVQDISTDSRLSKLNAIVFLQFKPKGKGKQSGYHSLRDVNKYRELIQLCEQLGVAYGFDSCSAGIYLSAIKDRPNYDKLSEYVEPCESSLFSFYINCNGFGFPCSFVEGESEWEQGIDILNCNDFHKDVWTNPRLIKWRRRLLNNGRSCFVYNLE